MKKIIKSPYLLYPIWVFLFFAFCVFVVRVLSEGHGGGWDLDVIADGLNIFADGFFIIPLLIFILFPEDFKKYWYINLVAVFLFIGSVLIRLFNQ